MTYIWTSEEIRAILKQLDGQNLPFKKYTLFDSNGEVNILGTGASAIVYEGYERNNPKKSCAIKVIGFGTKRIDPAAFRKSVEIQDSLSADQNNTVKIYGAVEIIVYVDENNRVTKTKKVDEYDNENINMEGDFLYLQFLAMEKLVPVIASDMSGRRELFPEKLAAFDENEIIKLAHDVGMSLREAHKRKLLHRDIKLENVFYSEKNDCYKLGDFGIAVFTDNGMASTVAYTKGYGAPEVVSSLDDKYDCTADIYSFGMMIFVLLNGLRFPDSENYNVNFSIQYNQGYILPEPKYGGNKIALIVEKMCRFVPDDRYQSVDAVMDDLDGIVLNERIRYKRQHMSSILAFGMVLFVIGVAFAKISFLPDLNPDFSAAVYIISAACISKWLLDLFRKNTNLISLVILIICIILLIRDGFVWWKLIVFLFAAFGGGASAGAFGLSVIAVEIAWLAMPNISGRVYLHDYRWVAVFLLAIGEILLTEYSILKERDRKTDRDYFQYNKMFWVCLTVFLALFLSGLVLAGGGLDSMTRVLGDSNWLVILSDIMVSVQIWKAGIAGMAFMLLWGLRERVLMLRQQAHEGDDVNLG